MNTEFNSRLESAGVIASVSTVENARVMAAEGVGAFLCADAQTAKEIKKALPELLVGSSEVCEGVDFYLGEVHCPKCVARVRATSAVLIAAVTDLDGAKAAHELGADLIGFVEAAQHGGISAFRDMVEELPDAKFIVRGAAEALYYDTFDACLGWVEDGIENSEDIAAEASFRMYHALALSLAHVGINGRDEEEAVAVSTAYSKLLGIQQKTGNSSCFAGKWVEVMKSPFLGERGHIAIGTESLVRAIGFYNRRGVEFNMDTAKPVAIYFKDEIGGFAVHLVQK